MTNMKNFKNLIKAQELNKIKALLRQKQITQDNKSGKFDMKLDHVQILNSSNSQFSKFKTEKKNSRKSFLLKVMRVWKLRLVNTSNLRPRFYVSSKPFVIWLVVFTEILKFAGSIYLFSNVISKSVLYKIIIGVVIVVLTFVSERYIFTNIHMSNFVNQSIKRSVLYFFILTITIFTFMAFGVNVYDLD